MEWDVHYVWEKSLKKETSIKLQFPFQGKKKKKEYWEYHQNKVFDSPFG